MKLRGSLNPWEPSPPWSASTARPRRKTCFHTCVFHSKSTNRQIDDIESKQTISWSINCPLTEKSVYSWVRWCFCLGLQSTTECSGAFGLKSDTFTFSFASFGKRKQEDPKCRLVLKISLTFGGEKTLDPGTLHPDQEDKDYHTG